MKIKFKKIDVKTVMRAGVSMIIFLKNKEASFVRANSKSLFAKELEKIKVLSSDFGASAAPENESLHTEASQIFENKVKIEYLMSLLNKLEAGEQQFDLTYSEMKVIAEAIKKYQDLIDDMRRNERYWRMSKVKTKILYLTSKWMYLKYDESCLILYGYKQDFWNSEYYRAETIIENLRGYKSVEQCRIEEILEMIR